MSEPPKPKIGILNEDTLNYYRRVSQSLEAGFENEEDKNLFVSNVVSQLSEEAVKVAQNQTASRIIEVLLSVCNKDQTISMLKSFSNDWFTVCTDRFASHVLQKILTALLPLFSQPGETIHHKQKPSSADDESSSSSDGEDTTSLTDLFLGLCDFIDGSIEEFICHTYASHIVRVVLEVLAGTSVEEKVVRSKLSRGQSQANNVPNQGPRFQMSKIPPEFEERLKTMADRIMRLDRLEDYFTETLSNTVIQTLLLVLHKRSPSVCQTYCKEILQKSGLVSKTSATQSETEDSETTELPQIVQNSSSSYLVEQLLALSSADVHQEMMEKVFKKRLIQFAVHPVANFVLQKVLSSVKEVDQFKWMFKELSPHLEDILGLSHMGVVTKLTEACHRLSTKQDRLVKRLLKAFHCYEPAERQSAIVPLLATLSTYEICYPTNTDAGEQEKVDQVKVNLGQVNLHGSVILQQLLRFDIPTLVVNSLLGTESAELTKLSCHPCGSHIIDTYFQSNSVGDKNREKMVHKLQGEYVELACSKNGSRALQTIWNVASLKQKVIIAEELAKHEAKVQGDKFGRFAYRNFAMYHFIHRRNDWKELQGARVRKRKMFEDILQDSGDQAKHFGRGKSDFSNEPGFHKTVHEGDQDQYATGSGRPTYQHKIGAKPFKKPWNKSPGKNTQNYSRKDTKTGNWREANTQKEKI